MWALQENKMKHSARIGINPTGPEWTELFNQHTRFHELMNVGDYEKFDRGEFGELLMKYADLANRWYDDGEDNARVRRILMDESCHRLTTCGNVMYIVNQGLPSGFGATAPANSTSNEFYVGCAYLELRDMMMTGQIPEVSDEAQRMWKEVMEMAAAKVVRLDMAFYARSRQLSTYGDDYMLSVTQNLLGLLNFETYQWVLAKFGVFVTPEDKLSDTYIAKSIMDSTFLKRTFKTHEGAPGLMMAPLDANVLREEVNWIRETEDEDEMTRQVADASIREAFHHGVSFFEQHKATINRALVSQGIAPIVHSYAELNKEFFEQFDIAAPYVPRQWFHLVK